MSHESHARRAAVLVKAVPVGGQFLRVVDDALVRDGVPHGLDPLNEVALEFALDARRSGALDDVVAICMGPDSAVDALRRALAVGADSVLHIADPGLVGADVRTTARVLAAAIRHADAGLALFGYESADGSSGMVPSAVAALLDRPLISRARDGSVVDGLVTASRDVGAGTEVASAELPAVVSVVDGGITPSYPTLKQVLRARKADIPTIDLAGLGIDLSLTHSRERVTGLRPVPARARERTVMGVDDGILWLADVLSDVATG
jgi:electron transfer flavoprotein beta subunit